MALYNFSVSIYMPFLQTCWLVQANVLLSYFSELDKIRAEFLYWETTEVFAYLLSVSVAPKRWPVSQSPVQKHHYLASLPWWHSSWSVARWIAACAWARCGVVYRVRIHFFLKIALHKYQKISLEIFFCFYYTVRAYDVWIYSQTPEIRTPIIRIPG